MGANETALLKVLNDLLHSLDHGNASVVNLLDLSAAFDTIDHTILLQRLEHVLAYTVLLYSSFLLTFQT